MGLQRTAAVSKKGIAVECSLMGSARCPSGALHLLGHKPALILLRPAAQMRFSRASTPMRLQFTAVLGWDEPVAPAG